MHEIKIRPARKSDRPGVLKLVLALTAEVTESAVPPMVAKRLRADVAAATSGAVDDRLLLAVVGNRLVGCGRAREFCYHPMLRFGADARHAYIELMYVVPNERGSGLAGRLLGSLEAWAASRGISHLT
jgi:GNAT superfamily N-acetyltransferase